MTEAFLFAGEVDDEEAWNSDTDRFDRRKIKIECPHCHEEFAPLCSPATEMTESGWRWHGCDHREPYGQYRTTHRRCGGKLWFRTYTPQ